jgi:hypothetical protein
MKGILALLMVAASSCGSVYMVPELNTCGVVINEKDCRMEEGDKMYLVQISKKNFIEHPTYKRYRVGDTICFKSTIKNFK